MTTAVEIPGYVAGIWDIDPVHSEVQFSVRHMGVGKARGRFDTFRGEIVAADNPLDSSVTATIDTASINTGNEERDNHVRSADFLDVANYPTMTYRSTGVRVDGDEYIVDGELTLRGVTRPVALRTELGGFGDGLLGLSATTTINRGDFGVGTGTPSAVLGDKITIVLEIEATPRS